MRTTSLPALLLIAAISAAASMADRPGFKDPALFTRMPSFYLSDQGAVKETQFDFFEFSVTSAGKTVRERVEGRKVVYTYSFDRTAGAPPSGLQVARNYQSAAKRLGGEVLYDGPSLRDTYNRTTLLLRKGGSETWVEVMTRAATYYVTIVERGEMQQDVVANADALKSGLAAQGHVEVPGIVFDFNKSDVKPESKPALDEVVKLLRASPTLRVWVVGHTDAVGTADFNVRLSDARAAAVVKSLVDAGIDAKRLTPHGNGPYAPVATNATDGGRAKNRRVELVAQP
jgi:outer membrane protein OmpA-like peptidoglycan-associated protein